MTARSWANLLLLLFALQIPAAGAASDREAATDELVAAGIVTKVGYIMAGKGSWERSDSIEQFKEGMKLIERDLAQFSDTDSGRRLRTEGKAMLDFIYRGVVHTLEPDDPEGAKFFEEAGLVAGKASASDASQAFLARLRSFSDAAGVDSSIPDILFAVDGNEKGPRGKAEE